MCLALYSFFLCFKVQYWIFMKLFKICKDISWWVANYVFFLFVIGHFIYASQDICLQLIEFLIWIHLYTLWQKGRRCASQTHFGWWLCLGHYLMNALIAYIYRYILMLWIVFPWLLLHSIINDILLTKIEYLLGLFFIWDKGNHVQIKLCI